MLFSSKPSSDVMMQRPDLSSSVSMNSNRSNDDPLDFWKGSQTDPSVPMNSDRSNDDPLDFWKEPQTDPREPASLDVLLTNLIKGNLLPSARLWITSRPSAAKQLRGEFDRVTEIRAVEKIPPEFIDKVTDCRESMKRQQQLASNLKNRFIDKIPQVADTPHPNLKNIEHIKEERSREVNDEHATGQTEAKSKRPVTSPIQTSDIFKHEKDERIRTVLTVGETGIGKSFCVQKFTRYWAGNKTSASFRAIGWMTEEFFGKGKDPTELIFLLKFNELNRKKEEKISLVGLLNHFFEETKESVISNYEELNVMFIFDGLDKCQLPLDFDNNDTLTDVREPASLDVLLTNLIKGNLLPSARLWITSRPSAAKQLRGEFVDRVTEIRAVQKIPPEYIDKVTECQESVKRQQQLASNLKNRFIDKIPQVVDTPHPNQKSIEHILQEKRSREVNDEHATGQTETKSKKSVTSPIQTSDIFKHEKDQTIRTVLTIGEAGIGKSFCVQKFTRDWAGNKTSASFRARGSMTEEFFGKGKDPTELIFLLKFSELNRKKEEKISLVGLLNHFFEETKQSVISNYEELNVLFIFDGLDECQLPLDFDNNDTLTDVREPASLDVLLTNLIKGNLLPSARLWITSRPSAAKQLRGEFVDRMTEIRERPDIVSQRNLKSQVKAQFQRVSEGIAKQENSALLNDIYTDLYIIEGDGGEVNSQHGSRQTQEALFKLVRQETPKTYSDIFKPASGQNKEIRTVLTNGIAGIGKTIASQKYMLDWAEGVANQDTFYTFPFPFRELNLRKEEEYSLEGLIHQFFPEMKTSEISNYDNYQILVVLDGLDECRLDLNFSDSQPWTDVTKPTSVNTLLTNLIQGNLLSKAQIWITSRPAASNLIPAENVDRVTEVRGFNDEQKEYYFRKRFSDEDLAERIISHVKKSRSLYIMCHIPVFCWITATVLEGLMSKKQEEGDLMSTNQEEEMPKTLTDIYMRFLLLQCGQCNVKYNKRSEADERSDTDSCWNTKNMKTILSLGKLAFEELEKGNLVFTEEDLAERGIDIIATAVYSGLFTQISRDDRGLYKQKLFCFVHMSIQEFLAAVHVFLTFNNKGENVLTIPDSTVAELPASDFYKSAVDKALNSDKGDWDLFLRFLLGLSLETNQRPLQELLTKTEDNKNTENSSETNKKTENSSETYKKTTEYIKEKIRGETKNADKNINLFHCLNELNDHSLVEEIKNGLSSGSLAYKNFSLSQWSALTFVLLTSNEKLDVFDLKTYLKSEQVLLGMLPVVKVSTTALLSWCDLSKEACAGLASSVLSSCSSNLTELDLSHNDLLDSGVELLSGGLKSLNCRLEILKLSGCQVTETGCDFLASALKSRTSKVKQLDLSYNHPGDSGVTMLSAIAEDPQFSLETLSLDHGGGHRLKPGMKKYGVALTFDENTASRRLVLSERNRKAKTKQKAEEKVSYPDHPDRFNRTQVLCEEGLTGLCYWEVEWRGSVGIGVAYRGVSRRGWDSSCGLGCNEMSWSLNCSKTEYTAWHETATSIKVSDPSQKIALFLNWEGGTLDYYSVLSGKLSHIHTFKAKFTEPLYPGFWFKKGSVSLCPIE
ncbi:uncharacterized protein [Centroberyx affinis]|uniref:uncharacterized protein n=1 Tax=Centroberyx affinis TaxID=166261 RepID=UPI003A5C6C08